MGDATGELTDRLHLLRHPQLLVERALFRKVLDECIEYVSATTAESCHFQLDLYLSPVSTQRIYFDSLAQDRASAALKNRAIPAVWRARSRSGTIKSPRAYPMTSSRDQPNSASACGFHPITRP